MKQGYAAVFGALQNILNGNITSISKSGAYVESAALWEASSRVLHTGLIGCDEIQHGGGWKSYPPLQTPNIQEIIGGGSWMCRNKTLNRAIEDLSINITTSMLSNPDFLQVVPSF